MRNTFHMSADHIRPSFYIVAVCSVLLACATAGTDYDQGGQKQEQGEEIGSVIGDLLGDYVPGGKSVAGQVLKANAGTIGGLVGGAIGAALDGEDLEALEQVTLESFDTGEPKSFASKRTGVRGSVKVNNKRINQNGQQCRTVRQDVRLKDGTARTGHVSACKGPNGWKG